MDACTTAMCDKKWGRPGFAKVLVNVWATGELKKEIQVVIPSLTGDLEEKVKVLVEYVWTPSQCRHCCVFGHKTSSCSKHKEGKEEIRKAQGDDRDDGFTQVRRKQWKVKTNKVNNNASSSGVKHNDGNIEEDKKTGNEEEKLTKERGSQDGESKEVENVSGEVKIDKVVSPKKIHKGDVKSGKAEPQGVKGGGVQTPGQIPFYQSVLKSFQPRRGVPLQTSNRFATLSSSDDEAGSCEVGSGAWNIGGPRENDRNEEMQVEEELETAVPDD